VISASRARAVLPHVYRLLRVLTKTSDEGQRRAWAAVAKIRERHDADFQAVFADWLSGVRDDLASMDADTRAGFTAGIRDAFATDALLTAYRPVLDDFLASFADAASEHVANLQIDYSVVNTRAVDSTTDAVSRYFGSWAQDQQERIHGILSDALAAGTPTRDIAAQLAEGMASVVYRDDQGEVTRTVAPEVWAEQVARTECNRAYVSAVQASLDSLGLTTWQFVCADDERTCDDCSPNDGAIVAIGDAFPSGDDAPPIHPACRCVTIAVSEELTGDDGSNDNGEQDGTD